MVETREFYSFFNVLIPVAGLAANVLTQVLSFRYAPQKALLKSICLGFATGLLTTIALEIKLYDALSLAGFASLATNIIIYSTLAYCYFHFLNLGETARRIRIVRELHDSPDGLSMDEILKRYNSRDMVNLRISRLVNNGQIVLRDGSYFIGKPIMLWMARTILLMKRILLGKTGTFEL